MTIQGNDIIAMLTGGSLELYSGVQATPPIDPGVSTELDTEMQDLAESIIEELGKTVNFTVYPQKSYSPATGATTVGTETVYQKKIIPPYPCAEKYVNGDSIRMGDMTTGLAGKDLEFVPAPGLTKVTIDSSVYNIVSMNPIYSGEQVALYILQLRR